jgi:hypothetical protein
VISVGGVELLAPCLESEDEELKANAAGAIQSIVSLEEERIVKRGRGGEEREKKGRVSDILQNYGILTKCILTKSGAENT